MAGLPANLNQFMHGESQSPRVLLIEPNTDDAKRIVQTIDTFYDQTSVSPVESLDKALAGDLDAYNLAFCAMSPDGADGLVAIEELLLIRPDMPIIMLVSEYSHANAAEIMREGAYDIVEKSSGYLTALPAVIEKNLVLHQVKQENARLQVQLTATLGQLRSRNEQLQSLVQELKAIASTDALTGIANRRAMTQSLDQQFAHAQRHDSELALIAIDLDGFKQLNDTCGHPAGDRVLMLLARVLSANARTSDLAGRIGGDEFMLLLPDTDPEEARQVAQRIQSDFGFAFADLAPRLGYTGHLTISAGAATRKQANTAEASELLAIADRALYRAKNAGRSCIVMHGEAI